MRFHEVDDRTVQRRVVHRVGQLVTLRRPFEVEIQHHIEVKGLRPVALAGVGAMPPERDDLAQRYPIHPAGLHPRTIASLTEITSRCCATSWTRTIATPARTPSAVVAAVP